ncbi:MAG: excinuclease ABC subunit UvrC [Candidatus Helarchaeota archaeon]
MELEKKLDSIPENPGCYFFKNGDEIIYIGKAVSLKKRVNSYFHLAASSSQKLQNLLAEFTDIEWKITDSEIEALLLESQLIKRYKPKYNTWGKDDKSFPYIYITDEDFPRIFVKRLIKNQEREPGKYFGPFIDVKAIKKTLRFILKTFPSATCSKPVDKQKRFCQKYQYKLCSAPCIGKVTKKEYNEQIDMIGRLLSGKKDELLKDLYKNMESASKKLDYEKAAEIRDQIFALEKSIRNIMITSQDQEFEITSEGVTQLKKLLNLKTMPYRIAGFDISNIGGTFATGSLVIFENGIPKKEDYRRFRIKHTGPDDVGMIKELLDRRYKKIIREKIQLPNLILIDGGKGQVNAASEILKKYEIDIPLLGLAKKNEEIFFPHHSTPIILPRNSKALFLLQRVRDEAHRFAISYHKKLRQKATKKSILEEIPGVGKKTRDLLIAHFGSTDKIKVASLEDLQKVPKLKTYLAEKIFSYFKKLN